MKIAIVSYKKQPGITNDEDADLIAFLKDKGLNVVYAVWNDESIDWNGFDVAIIKSPWDYHHHLSGFLAWADRIARSGVKVLNPVEIIKWNSHKKYLKDLAGKGLPVIPTAYIEKGTAFDNRFFELFDTDRLVVKPCVSAGAQNTLVLNSHDQQEYTRQIEQLLKTADYIVQPFADEIKNGEWSFLFFNGKYSHCALKTPKQGDFRVQQDHGGHVSYPVPDPVLIGQTGAYLQHLPQTPLYARVDGIMVNNIFQLMELELIEPYLFFNDDRNLLENYYQALMELITEWEQKEPCSYPTP